MIWNLLSKLDFYFEILSNICQKLRIFMGKRTKETRNIIECFGDKKPRFKFKWILYLHCEFQNLSRILTKKANKISFLYKSTHFFKEDVILNTVSYVRFDYLEFEFAIDKNNYQKFITNIRNWNTYRLDGRKWRFYLF